MAQLQIDFGLFNDFVRQLLSQQPAQLPHPLRAADWQTFLRTLAQHRAQPLVQYFCQQQAVVMPENITRKLNSARKRQVIAELAEAQALQKILAFCAEANIPCLLLKGIAMAYQFYPEAGLRPRCDVDILIHPKDWQHFETVALQNGLRKRPGISGDLVSQEHGYILANDKGANITFDVHRELSNHHLLARKISFQTLATASLPITKLSPQAKRLATPYALLHACFHRAVSLTKEGERLIWLYDLRLLLQALSTTEQQQFVQLATQLQIAKLCQSALEATAHWCGLPLQSEMHLALTRAGRNEKLSKRMLNKRHQKPIGRLLTNLHALPNTAERLQFLKENTWPTEEYMRQKYASNAFLLWLHTRRLAEGLKKLLSGRQ